MRVEMYQRRLQDLQERFRSIHEQNLKQLQSELRETKEHNAKLLEATKPQQHIVDVRA